MDSIGHLVRIAVSPAPGPRQVQDLIGPLTGYDDLVAIFGMDGLVLDGQVRSGDQKINDLGPDGDPEPTT
jgi:hypothetical protein